MKGWKILKRLNNIFLCLVVLGLIALGFFYYRGGKLVSALEVERMGSHIVENYQDIKKLQINIDLSEVHVGKSDQEYVEVIYPVFKDKEIIVEQKGDVLEINMEEKGKLLNFTLPSFDTEAYKTIVKIPKNYILEDMEVNLAMGDFYTSDIMTKASTINLEMGKLHANNSNLGIMDTKLNMGSMAFNGVELAGNSQIQMDIGSFEETSKSLMAK